MTLGTIIPLANGLANTQQEMFLYVCIGLLVFIGGFYPSLRSEANLIALIQKVRAQKKRIKELKKKLGE